VAYTIKWEAVMNLQGLFATHTILTSEELVTFFNSQGQKNARTQASLLRYHTQKGRLSRIRRGLYLVVPPAATPKTCPVDPYLLASKLTKDAILAYHTALAFHGKAHSVSEQFLYLTDRQQRPTTFRNYRFRAVLVPRALRRKRKETTGVKVLERSGEDIRVTSLERTLVDVLDRPDLGGGWEELWRSLESIEFFDLEQVVRYALLLDNATTTAKVGFFLDQHRQSLMVEDSHLQRLRRCRPKAPHYIERNSRTQGKLVPAWNLIVPEAILKRSWQEPQ
jgi:predicted transcriptional regulator of viral defense system